MKRPHHEHGDEASDALSPIEEGSHLLVLRKLLNSRHARELVAPVVMIHV